LKNFNFILTYESPAVAKHRIQSNKAIG